MPKKEFLKNHGSTAAIKFLPTKADKEEIKRDILISNLVKKVESLERRVSKLENSSR